MHLDLQRDWIWVNLKMKCKWILKNVPENIIIWHWTPGFLIHTHNCMLTVTHTHTHRDNQDAKTTLPTNSCWWFFTTLQLGSSSLSACSLPSHDEVFLFPVFLKHWWDFTVGINDLVDEGNVAVKHWLLSMRNHKCTGMHTNSNTQKNVIENMNVGTNFEAGKETEFPDTWKNICEIWTLKVTESQMHRHAHKIQILWRT